MISLKVLQKSDAASHIYLQKQTNPACYLSNRCLSNEFSRNLKHTMTEKVLKPSFSHQPNIYLTKNLFNNQQTDKIKRLPSILSMPSNKVIFKSSTGVSLKQTNISFSYTSPPKTKRFHSAESRFSTKKFKSEHFPLLGQDQNDGSPIKRIVKSKQNRAEMIFTKEKTPDKHKILKVKKQKQSNKLITFKKHTKQNNQKGEIQIAKPQNNQEHSLDGPRNTPINALWTNDHQKTIKEASSQSILKNLEGKNNPTSIELIKERSKNNSKNQLNLIMEPPTFQHLVQPTQDRASNKKYPTVQSLEVYQSIKNTGNTHHARRDSSRQDLTSLRIMLEQNLRQPSSKSIKNLNDDLFLAKSIVQQLQLHYDYCFALEDSDKSLSIHVSL